MYSLQTFDYKSSKIMIIVRKNGEILFDASNICHILEYSRNAVNVLAKLDDDEKLLITREEFNGTESVPLNYHDAVELGPRGEKWFLTEPGLYHLILRSDKPEAKPFRRWVTHEVLPSIRKTGSYSAPGTADLGKIANTFARAKKLAQTAGMRERAAIKEADRITKEQTGTSPVGMLRPDAFDWDEPEKNAGCVMLDNPISQFLENVEFEKLSPVRTSLGYFVPLQAIMDKLAERGVIPNNSTKENRATTMMIAIVMRQKGAIKSRISLKRGLKRGYYLNRLETGWK